MDKGYCGFCGQEVYQKDEGEFGIICPKCHHDFWFSETLPENYWDKGYSLLGV
jgi:hypothetical protein